MTRGQPYRLRNGRHNIEKEVAPLIEIAFPEYEDFFDKHLIPLTEDGHWRNDTLDYLEFIGMASFSVLKSINFINRNIDHIKRGDPDQRFKNIYFHFGLAADSVESLSRNIALTSDFLGIKSIDKNPKEANDLIKSFEKWVQKKYSKSLEDLVKRGRQVVYHLHSIDFLKETISADLNADFKTFVKSLKDYRNFYTHNPGVDIIQISQNQIYVVKRQKISEADSWSNLRLMLRESLDDFVNPKEQVTNDLEMFLNYLRKIWVEFDKKMNEIEQHKDFGQIFQGFKRKLE